MIIAKQEDKYGIFDLEGTPLLKPEYDYIEYTQDSLFYLRKDSLWGILDMELKTILPLEYTDVSPMSKDNFYTIKKNGRYGVLDRNNKKITIPTNYIYIKPSKNYHRSGKAYATAQLKTDTIKESALVNLDTGEVIFNFGEYDYIEAYDEYGAAVVSKDGMSAIIDFNNKILVPMQEGIFKLTKWGYIYHFPIDEAYNSRFISFDGMKSKDYDNISSEGIVENMIEDKKDKQFIRKKGFIDKDGKEIIAPIYDEIALYNTHIETIIYPENYSDLPTSRIFDLNGKSLSKALKYDAFEYYPNLGLIQVDKDDEAGLINVEGKTIFKPQYRSIYIDTIEQRIRLTSHDLKMKLTDRNGKILGSEYDDIDQFFNGISKVGISKNGKYLVGLIDVNGKEILDPQPISLFFDMDDEKKFALMYKNNKVGVLSADGKTTVEPIYDEIIYNSRYNDDWSLIAITRMDKKMGLINISTGEILAKPIYKHIFSMGKGDSVLFCLRDDDGNNMVMDKYGKILIPPTLDIIYSLSYDSDLLIKKNQTGKVGLINRNNEIVIPIMYDEIEKLDSDQLLVKNNGQYGVINEQNEILVPLDYDYLSLYNYSDNLLMASKDQKKGFLLNQSTFVESPFAEIILEKQNK